jgi:TolA-binding protein
MAQLKQTGRHPMTWTHRALLTGIILAGLAAPAAAQQATTVTQSDIQRLQDNVYLADRDVSQARSRDAARANQLQTELDDLRDEVVYLKVKLRKDKTLARSEYADVRDRIDDLRSRARGEATASSAPPAAAPAPGSSAAAPAGPRIISPTSAPAPAPAPAAASTPAPAPAPTRATTSTTPPPGAVEVPVSTEIDVRLQSNLNSGTSQVEDRFEATTLVDVGVNSRVVIPAGSVMRGVVTAVEPATRTNRTARLTVSFDQVTVNGQPHAIRGTVTQAIEGEGIKGETARIGAGAGVGAIIGGILGGFKGALAGILIGGGGTIAATEGKEVEIPQGSVLRVRLDSPAYIQTGR